MSLTPSRRILHVDMDAFFASVEQLDNPALRGQPLIVAGSEKARGVVAAASYEARAFGVRSAMPTSRALRLCPQVLRVPPRHARYHEMSREIHAVLEEFTGLIEPLSMDESYLDVTDRCLRDKVPLAEVAHAIKVAVRERTGLTASAGGGPNKFVAKIASDASKPDGLLVIAPRQVTTFLRPLPVERIWGVGPVTAQRLHALGLRTIGDVADRGAHWLEQHLGRSGAALYSLACGDDERPVVTQHETRSISSECTFPTDVDTTAEVLHALREQADEVGERLMALGCEARTVTLKVRYGDFTTVTRSVSSVSRIGNAADIFAALPDLLARTEFPRRAVRLVGVGVSGLSAPRATQLLLPFDGA